MKTRRTRPAPPCCSSAPRWIAQRLKDKYALAPLTGTDWRALKAFLHLVELYGSTGGDGRRCAVVAMAHTVRTMQSSTRHLAKAGIPHVLDWSHEEEIWRAIVEALDEGVGGNGSLDQALNEGDGSYRP